MRSDPFFPDPRAAADPRHCARSTRWRTTPWAARTLDTTAWKVHNRHVGPTRLNIPDARGRGATLRVTRQPGQRRVVFSHWSDGRCVASTPIELGEVPGLIAVLVDALGVAVDMGNRAVSRANPEAPGHGSRAEMDPPTVGAGHRASIAARAQECGADRIRAGSRRCAGHSRSRGWASHWRMASASAPRGGGGNV